MSLLTRVGLMSVCFTLIRSQSGPGIPCVCLEEVVPDLLIKTTMAITNANDGSGRLFVAEQVGVIWIYYTNGSRLDAPFINISDRIQVTGSTGLLNMAFHPSFSSNGLVYVYATLNDSQSVRFQNTVLEYSLSGTDPDKLNRTTERVVFEIECGGPDDCHNGGAFVFGADGYLYIGHGDEGCCGDVANSGQNRSNYLAAIHRIDVDTRTGNLEYGIPADNPFLSDPGTVPEMYSYGWRQPYKASMDRGDPDTGYGYGRIMIGDVGDGMWEEVNILQRGGNYGWSVFEGPDCFKPQYCSDIGEHVLPVAAYNHTNYGICIISGDVYRGREIPELNGWFLYKDYFTEWFFGMYEVGANQWDWRSIPVCTTCPAGLTNQYPPYTTAMGASEEGEEYFAATTSSGANSIATKIFKIAKNY